MRLRESGPVLVATLLIATALTGCADGATGCDPQALLEQEQTDADAIAADDLAVIADVDGSTTHLLEALGDDGASFYLGASHEGDICLIIVADGPVAGCSGGADGMQVGSGSIAVKLVAEDDQDAVPSGARTEEVPDGCLVVRTS